MSIKWTEDYLQHVLNTLKNSASYKEALAALNETGSSIRNAFRSVGFDAPSSYVGANLPPDDTGDTGEEDDVDFDDAAFEDFIHPENYYVSGNWVMVYTPKRFYKIPKEYLYFERLSR